MSPELIASLAVGVALAGVILAGRCDLRTEVRERLRETVAGRRAETAV